MKILTLPKKILNLSRFTQKFSIILSLIAILTISCLEDTLPTYSRQDIAKIIKNMCLDEFKIEVKVWDAGNTIWVYAPFENVLNEKKDSYREEISDKLSKIYLSMARTILSMDKRPDFYCFLISDIKEGIDIYNIWYIPDFIKFQFGRISRGQFLERRVFLFYNNPFAINDKEGSHVKISDISLAEFISYLIQQNAWKKFNSQELRDYVEIKAFNVNYDRAISTLSIEIDAVIKEYKIGFVDPTEEIKSIAKKFLTIYKDQLGLFEIVSIKIKDNYQTKVYGLKSFLEESNLKTKTF